MTEFGLVSDFAQLICVNDEALAETEKDPELLHSPEFIAKCIDSDGNNAVIARLELRNRHDILKYVEILLQSFDSVSWYRNGRLFIRRRV
jgi:hypothetical protein